MNGAPLQRHLQRGHRLVVAAPFEAGALALGLDRPEGRERIWTDTEALPGGRTEHRRLVARDWPGPVRLRPARHGGALGPWLGDRYLDGDRPARELRVWSTLHARGAPLPEPVLALSWTRGPFWRHAFASLEVSDATDGAACLRDRDAEELAAGIAAAAEALRRFHDAGGLHGDLQVRNLLLSGPTRSPRCWLVDLDRARLVSSPSPRQRMKEILRLARSVEKLGLDRRIGKRGCARFLDAYCRGDRGLRRALRASGGRGGPIRHRMAWRLRHSLVGALTACALLGALSGPGCSGEAPADRMPASERLSLLAVGDTGRSRSIGLLEGQRAVGRALEAEDRRAPVDALVLLGDNFYWHGLDRERLVERVRENLVAPYCHFLALTGPRSDAVRSACPHPEPSRHPVPVHAVLGNHDLELPDSARLQREVVPEYLPGWNMSPGLAEVVELGEGVSLILFESEVAIRDEAAIRKALVAAVREARGPWRILATHRPVATDDLGGVPVGGYPYFVRDALAAADAPVQLVLAGHHHNLQVFELEEPTPLLQVGLGSGSRAERPLAAIDHPAARFGAIELGFARVDLRGDGSDERLVISLFGGSRWPIWTTLRGTRLRARFAVDRAGRMVSPH